MKHTFTVVIHYEGAFDYEIVADDEEEAKEIAWERYNSEPDSEFTMNLADSDICDVWED